ncbi:M48 family metalloprotease [Dyella subtropica]|uniref:M48 family metalloprotease n=1 Tax=Dyella subtropica TaxID=2992127 RepID=UPI002254FE80|nr:M48 family metalloprotease [Dyella subtropica]
MRFVLCAACFGWIAWPALAGDVGVPPPSPAAQAWTQTLNWTWVAERALYLLLPLGLLLSGWSARLGATFERCAGGRRYVALILFASTLLLISAVLRLPLNAVRHLAYPGKFPDSLGQWWAGQAEALVLPLACIALLLWIPYWLMRRSPRRWWLWLAIVAAPLSFAALVLQPAWMAFSTNGYEPLKDEALSAEIRGMAGQCGVPDIHVVVGGGDTTVVGLGPTNRVILASDLLKTETPAQIRFTVAHELKHYVMGDNWKAWAIIVLFVLSAFCFAHMAGRFAIARWGVWMGFSRLDDVRSLPLLILCVTLFWIAITPVFLTYDRHIEREADRFGLELSRENDAAAQLFASWVGPTELAEPGWFARTTRGSHPSTAERIRMAQSYRPWATGESLQYATICR